MAAKQRLGKGFDVLMPKGIDAVILEEDKNRVQKLLIRDIIANPDQPRRQFDPGALEELTLSVKRFGILQPIIVIRQGKNYKIVAGERRWRAAQAAKLTHVPAVVRSLKELEQVELSLIENIQRVDLSPLEQALSVYRLQQQFNLSLEDIAKRLGKAHSTVSNLIRLLQLPEAAMESLKKQKISEGHARAILALKHDIKAQTDLLRCILNNKWSVREAEQYVAEHKRHHHGHDNKAEEVLLDKIKQKIKVKAQIKRKKTGGQIIIPFKSEAQLKNIVDRLA